MVEIRFALADAAGIRGLARRLTRLFDRSSVSFDPTLNEVHVHSEWESRSITQVIDVIESWLASSASGSSAELRIGGRSYTMQGRPSETAS